MFKDVLILSEETHTKKFRHFCHINMCKELSMLSLFPKGFIKKNDTF